MTSINPFVRFLSMCTTLNLIAHLLYHWMPPFAQDIVRASSLLILLVTGSAWIFGDIRTIYHELYYSFTTYHVPSHVLYGIVFLFDVLFHLVPVLIIGLPHHAHSMWIGIFLLLVWYCMNRHRIHDLYAPSVPRDTCISTAVLGGMLYALCIYQ